MDYTITKHRHKFVVGKSDNSWFSWGTGSTLGNGRDNKIFLLLASGVNHLALYIYTPLTLARSPSNAKALCRTSGASSMQHWRRRSFKLLCDTCRMQQHPMTEELIHGQYYLLIWMYSWELFKQYFLDSSPSGQETPFLLVSFSALFSPRVLFAVF